MVDFRNGATGQQALPIAVFIKSKPCANIVTNYNRSNFGTIWILRGDKKYRFDGLKYENCASRTPIKFDSILLFIVGMSCHRTILNSHGHGLVVFKPGAMHPATAATIETLACFCISDLWTEMQTTRYVGCR